MLRVGNKFKLILFGVLILSTLLPLMVSGPVYATIGNPDTISIPSVRVFTDVWETGDQLYFVEYQLLYDPTPNESVSSTFYAGIFNGSSLLRSKPLVYYQHNIICIYLDAANALDPSGNYIVRLAGNPVYFPTLVEGVNQSSWGLSSSHWLASTYLCDYVLDMAQTLETSWGVTLLDTNNRLTDAGETTFEEQIPDLNGECPDIYAYSVTYPQPTYATNASTYQPILSARIPTRLQNAFNGIGNWIGIPGVYIGGILAAGLYLLLVGRLYLATGSQVGSIVIGMPFFLLMFLIGIIPLVVFFVFGTIVIVLAGIVFILGRFA